MQLDERRIDDAVLALLYLTLHDGNRAWKTIDWETLTASASAASSPTPLVAPNLSRSPTMASPSPKNSPKPSLPPNELAPPSRRRSSPVEWMLKPLPKRKL